LFNHIKKVVMFTIGLIIFGTCVVSGGLGAAAIASDDKKHTSPYQGEGYNPWTDDPNY
jgi:hypothetical protein